MSAFPARTALSDTYPNPSNATMRTGMGALWDAITGLLGTSGNPADALIFQGGGGTVVNLKLAVNAAVNKLDIFTRSGGAAPDATHRIAISIPDGNSNVMRERAATYLSGAMQFIMADAANYWSKGSLDAELKNAYVYAIWDGSGIVFALAGFSGFHMVPTTTTATDDDYFLLEDSSSYTRSNSHYCVCIGKIRYQYDTADTPDHTIQATVENGPKVVFNPPSDYGYTKTLAASVSQGSDITEYSAISVVVKQAGLYDIDVSASGTYDGGAVILQNVLKTGSATYGSAVEKIRKYTQVPATLSATTSGRRQVPLNSGDTIHCGVALSGASGVGSRILWGDNNFTGGTTLTFSRRS